MNEKVCTKCQVSRPVTEFSSRGAEQKHLLKSQCKTCICDRQRALYAIDPSDSLARSQAHRRSTRYGKPEGWYDEQLARQGGGCAICEITPEESTRSLHIDHDHKCCPPTQSCGLCVRGILCHGCNTALAQVESVPDWAEKALIYLRMEVPV